MNPRLMVAMTAATMFVAGCGKHNAAQTSNTTSADASENNAVATAAASPDQAFANTAAASDTFEIQSSQLAAANASSSAVKSFARHMIDAHTSSTAKLKTAAAGVSPAITPTPTLTADQQQQLDSLKSQKGAAFDSAYIDAQVAALEALRNYAASGEAPALKTFASQMIPIVTAHLNSAKALKK